MFPYFVSFGTGNYPCVQETKREKEEVNFRCQGQAGGRVRVHTVKSRVLLLLSSTA